MKVARAELLQQITDAIVAEVAPERIILFGSQGRGEAGPRSDVDLVVVERDSFGPDRSRRAEAARITWACRRFEIPQDVVLCSEAEFSRWSGSRNHPLGRAAREGRVVYERR